jgi:hypothetical protein
MLGVRSSPGRGIFAVSFRCRRSVTSLESGSRIRGGAVAAHRVGDVDEHCGGRGKMMEGSPNVLIGDRRGLKPRDAVTAPEASIDLHETVALRFEVAMALTGRKDTPLRP